MFCRLQLWHPEMSSFRCRPLSLRQQEQHQRALFSLFSILRTQHRWPDQLELLQSLPQRQLVLLFFRMLVLKLLHLSRQTLYHLSKPLALIVALIFKILEHVVKTRSVAMGNNNNTNVFRHNLSNNVNHLSSRITRKSLSTWKDK